MHCGTDQSLLPFHHLILTVAMIPRMSLVALSVVLPLAQAATWAGCYDPSAPDSLAGASTTDASSSGDCIVRLLSPFEAILC